MAQISIETINDHISMIDFELSGVKRIGALYLIKGDKKTCLVDSGTKESAKRIIKGFPPLTKSMTLEFKPIVVKK